MADTSDLLAGNPADAPTWPPEIVYEFLQVNGFLYRCNKVTGEMWKLEPSAQDKKTHVWKLIDDAVGAH